MSTSAGAARFAGLVLSRLHADSDLARAWLQLRARGTTAVIGLEDDGQWVPLLRFANGSGAFNVMDVEVRHHTSWAHTGVRGVPDAVADVLVGSLRFTWEFHVTDAETWKRTSDQRH